MEKKNHICKCIAFAISTFTIKEEMASANSMLCTIFLHNFLCDGIASFKPHCMSVIQLIDNIVSDSMIDVTSHLSIDIAIKGPTLYRVFPVIVIVILAMITF